MSGDCLTCLHTEDEHTHLRDGTDCCRCLCRSYVRSTWFTRARRWGDRLLNEA